MRHLYTMTTIPQGPATNHSFTWMNVFLLTLSVVQTAATIGFGCLLLLSTSAALITGMTIFTLCMSAVIAFKVYDIYAQKKQASESVLIIEKNQLSANNLSIQSYARSPRKQIVCRTHNVQQRPQTFTAKTKTSFFNKGLPFFRPRMPTQTIQHKISYRSMSFP